MRDAPAQAATRTGSSAWRQVAILALFVCTAVTAVHWPVLSAQTISFDDDNYLFSNPPLMHPSRPGVVRVLTEVLDSSKVRGYYEGLTLVSLMGDVALGGSSDNLRPFHRTSLALHVLNTLLLIILLQLLFNHPWAAAAVGLLFGLHPLTIEPVAWVWERKTVLATALVLGCLILYVLYTRRGGLRWYLAALGLFALALMAKPTVTPVPILLALLDGWPLRRARTANRKVWFELGLEKVPYLLIAALSTAITMLSLSRTAILPEHSSVASIPLRICYLILFYLGKIVWPAKLSSVYLLPAPVALSTPIYLIAVLGITVMVIGLVLLIRRAPALSVGMLFFIVAIAPTLGIIQYSWVAASDKYVYFPAFGLLLVVCWLLVSDWTKEPEAQARVMSEPRTRVRGPAHHLRGGFGKPSLALRALLPWTSYGNVGVVRAKRHGILVVVILSLACLEAIATRRYLAHWQTTERFFRHMLTLSPNAEPLHTHLGWWLMKNGREAEALSAYAEALRLNPYAADAHFNLGMRSLRRGEFGPAIEHLRAAVAAKPNDALAQMNLGLALLNQGDLMKAGDQFALTADLQPEWAEPHINLGLVLLKLNHVQEAADQFREALRISPDPVAQKHLEELLETVGASSKSTSRTAPAK